MSWKNFLAAGLLCVLASPVFAAPAINVTKNLVDTNALLSNNYLNSDGDWVWNVQISNTDPIPTGSSPLAAELGFSTSTALKGASNLSTGAGDDFDTVNPGTGIFGWELPGTGTNGFPEGIQTNCASGCTVNNSLNQLFSALGSIDFGTVGPHDYIKIVTRGPSDGLGGVLGSSLTVSGAYTGKGRIAEVTGASTTANYDTYNNVFTRTAVAGDANMNGVADDGDLNIVLTNLNIGSGKKWFDGNFNNHSDATTDDGDLNIMLTNLNVSSGTIGDGAGLSGGGAVPEPASITLMGLAVLGGLGLARRKR